MFYSNCHLKILAIWWLTLTLYQHKLNGIMDMLQRVNHDWQRNRQEQLLFTHTFHYNGPSNSPQNVLLCSRNYHFSDPSASTVSRLHQHVEATLEIRIRRLVRDVARFSMSKKSYINKDQPLPKRIAWCFMLLLCSSLCLYEISARVNYYFQEPISTNVERKTSLAGSRLSLLLCAPDTDDLAQLIKKHNMQRRSNYCYNPVKDLLSNNNAATMVDWNIDDIFDATGVTNWNASTLSACLVRGFSCRKEKKGIKIATSDDLIYYGKAKRFDIEILNDYTSLSFEVTIGRPLTDECGDAAFVFSLQEYGIPLDINKFVGSVGKTAQFVIAEVKSYQFLSRRVNPCVAKTSEYQRCLEACRINKQKNIAKCRLPFIPKGTNLTICNISVDTPKLYDDSVSAQRQPILDQDCPQPCGNPCEIQSTTFEISYIGRFQNKTTLTVHFSKNSFTSFMQKSAYEFGDLLADIGGILGLCLGLSILSLLETLQSLLRSLLINSKPTFYNSDPLYRKVSKCFAEYMSRTLLQNKSAPPKQTRTHDICWHYVMRFLIVFVSSVASLLFIYNRITFFFTYPTRNLIDVTRLNFVEFPTIMDCLEGKLVRKMRRRVAQLEKRSWCNVDMLDLLDAGIPGLKAGDLWKHSLDNGFLNTDFMAAQFGMPTPVIKGKEVVHLPTGSCVQFHVGTHLYVGISGSFITMVTSRMREFAQCAKDYRTVYILSKDEDMLDLKRREIYFAHSTVVFTLSMQKIKYWNSPKRPCIPVELFLKCRKKCLLQKLLPVIDCSLPFLPPTNLTECQTTKDAKKTREAYLWIVSGLDAIKDCNCIKSCLKTIYKTSTHLAQHNQEFSFAQYFFNSNVVETFEEVWSYSLGTFFCDIGGNLGLTLGFSLLSVPQLIDMFHISFLKLLRGRKRIQNQ